MYHISRKEANGIWKKGLELDVSHHVLVVNGFEPFCLGIKEFNLSSESILRKSSDFSSFFLRVPFYYRVRLTNLNKKKKGREQ